MSHPIVRLSMVLALAAACGAKVVAAEMPKDFGDPNKWPKKVLRVNNNSEAEQNFNLKKDAPLKGDVYVWKANESKDKGGFLHAKYHDVYTLRAKTKYYIYPTPPDGKQREVEFTLEMGQSGTQVITSMQVIRTEDGVGEGKDDPGDQVKLGFSRTMSKSMPEISFLALEEPTDTHSLVFLSFDDAPGRE